MDRVHFQIYFNIFFLVYINISPKVYFTITKTFGKLDAILYIKNIYRYILNSIQLNVDNQHFNSASNSKAF